MLSGFGRLVPYVLAAALVLPASRTGAGLPEAHLPDPTAALHDEVEALAATREAGLGAAELAPRVDVLVAGLPLELLASRTASPELQAAAEALFDLRAHLVVEAEGLPTGGRGEFLAALAPGAMYSDVVYGVPACITLAQAVLESGWGRSAPAYNLFGMKGVGPAGSTERRVVEYSRGRRGHRVHPFRAYHSFAESMADHARALAGAERYAAARAVADDPAAYARALRGKYATDPRYDKKLMALVELYGLTRFDWAPQPAAVADAED